MRAFYDRRDFLRISGLSAGTLALSQLFKTPVASAKVVYPERKITWIVPNKPGGAYDIIARALSPYLTKHLKSLSPGAAGGDIVVKD